MNTPEGRKKAVETNKKKDPEYYKNLGRKGGQNSTSRPMNDPDFASKAAKKGWEERKKRKAEEEKDGDQA